MLIEQKQKNDIDGLYQGGCQYAVFWGSLFPQYSGALELHYT